MTTETNPPAPGIIRQIVPWEERYNRLGLSWFESTNGREFDLVVVTPVKPEYERMRQFRHRTFHAIVDAFLPPVLGGRRLSDRVANVEEWPVLDQSFAFWAIRPHDLKQGDMVNLNVHVSKA